MKDEIKEQLEKGCGRKFEHINGYWICGEKGLLCFHCGVNIEQHQKSTEAERKRILSLMETCLGDNSKSTQGYSKLIKEINEAVKE
jgi:hypothetical protein